MNYTYYLSANTSGGYISFFDECVAHMRKIIVLKNGTSKFKKILFDKIIEVSKENDINYDKIIKCGTASETAAVILEDLSTVVADYDLFINDIPLYADVVDFAEHLRLDIELQSKLTEIKNKITSLNERMFYHLDNAKLIHDRWEQIYISNMNFDKLNAASDELVNGIFDGIPYEKSIYINKNRFFGSLIPRDNINYISELTENISKKIYIKGRPGTGKSTLLKKVVSKAKEYGYSTESYYCSFDPHSLDMVIIRKIGIALFDSTSPHEIFPCGDSDEVFDTYDIAIRDDVDEYCGNEIMRISSEYNHEIHKAKECLYTINAYIKKLDGIISNESFEKEQISRILAMLSFD